MKQRYRPAGQTLLLLGSIVAFQLLWSQPADSIKANYAKDEYQIPMRDGKKLFTAVYQPKDKSKQYPIMLTRTPYGVAPYGTGNYPSSLGPSDKFARDGFIFVYQDVRGRKMSEGDFVNVTPYREFKSGAKDIDESSDTYDTIDWLLKHLGNCNGRVGMWGISYPGFYAAQGMIDAHPALKAVSPQAPVSDWFVGDDFHHNGALFLPHAFNFLAGFGHPRSKRTTEMGPAFEHGTPDGYNFFLSMGPLSNANSKYFKNDVPFWNEMMEHGTYDAFWQARNLRPHLKNIRPAVMTVGGWFDAEDLFGALNVYQAVEKNNPGIYNILVMGPWHHGAWSSSDGDSLGNVRFGSKTSVFYRDEIEFPFFVRYLKGDGEPKLPEAYVFETGKNEWKRYEAWPPPRRVARNLYLLPHGKLSFNPPEDDSLSFDEYVSDPSKPVPYINRIVIGMAREYMVEDQRFASRRTDVLVYQSDELHSDITFAGPLAASLQVSTSGTDSDYVIKLIDVYPDNTPDNPANACDGKMGGFEQLVRGEPFRGKFRNSFEQPEPFVPGQVTKVEFSLPDINHTFRKGHRIMVQVQSSWFPLVDRNPQKFMDIYHAKADDFIKATERVYHSKSAPSFIRVGILD